VIKKKKTRNRFEAKIERQLKRSRIVFKYETERIPYILARHYVPDFILTTPTGKVYIECKGYLRPEDKCKLIAVKKYNPHLDIRIVFYESRKKYIAWAERAGFRWSIGIVPKDWLVGL
jgi:hypothetical protein